MYQLGEPFRIRWQVEGLPRGEQGAHATLQHIKRAARQDAGHPEIRLLAQELTRDLVPYDVESEVRVLHAFVRDDIRYVGDVYGVETVQSPRLTLRVGSGDCDDKTALLAALLLSIGHPVRYVLARTNPLEPRTYSHVFVETPLRGRWTPLETIVPGRPVGWQPRQYGPAHREKGGAVYVSSVGMDGVAGTELSGFWKKLRKWQPGKTVKKVAPFAAGGAALLFGGPLAAAAAVKAGKKIVKSAQSVLATGGGIISTTSVLPSPTFQALVAPPPPSPPIEKVGLPAWALPVGFGLLAVAVLGKRRRG